MDDDPGTRDTLTWFLGLAGMLVETVASGVAGLARASQGSFDLLIVDLKLPGLDGLEVMERLHQLGVNIPFVILSAFVTEEVAAEAFRLGAAGVLQKSEIEAALVVPLVEAARTVRSGLTLRSIAEPPKAKAMQLVSGAIDIIGRGGEDPGSATMRWVLLVLKFCEVQKDPPTLVTWARIVGVSYMAASEMNGRPSASYSYSVLVLAGIGFLASVLAVVVSYLGGNWTAPHRFVSQSSALQRPPTVLGHSN